MLDNKEIYNKLVEIHGGDRHIIIIGHAASGKDTLQSEIVYRMGLKPLISTTTRPMREGEVEGVEYHFVDEETFADANMIDRRSFLTVGEDNPWYYGFDAAAAMASRVSVLDLAGAKNLIQFYILKGMPVPQIVYLDTDRELCRERYLKRGGSSQEFYRRFRADYNWQLEAYRMAAYVITTNLEGEQDDGKIN